MSWNTLPLSMVMTTPLAISKSMVLLVWPMRFTVPYIPPLVTALEPSVNEF